MTDGRHPIVCENCGEQPALVRLGSKKHTEHAAYGVECACQQPDAETPVGSYVEIKTAPDALDGWSAVDE